MFLALNELVYKEMDADNTILLKNLFKIEPVAVGGHIMIFKTINNKILEQSNTFVLVPGNDDLLPLIEPKVDISDDILETTCKNMDNETKKLFINYINKNIKEK